MKKIIFILLILTLLVTACSTETIDNTQETTQDDQGFVEDLDQELDNSDLDSLDEDLNLDWI